MTTSSKVRELVRKNSGRITVIEVAIALGMADTEINRDKISSHVESLVKQGQIHFGTRATWVVPGVRNVKRRRLIFVERDKQAPKKWKRPRLYSSVFNFAQGIECPRPTI